MGLCFAGSGFPVLSKLCIGGFCSRAPPNRAHMFHMCGSCLGSLQAVGAPGAGGVDLILKCSARVHVYCYTVVAIRVPRVRQGQWSAVIEGQ